MSLLIWLPLNGNLKNQGLENSIITNYNTVINNSGKIGKCYYFDGSSYITASLPNIQQYPTSEFSMCAWVYFPSKSSGNKQILSIGTSSGWGNIRFGILYYTNNPRVMTSISDGTNYVAYNCWTTIRENEWNHVAAVYKNRTLYLYVDGVLAKTYNTSYDISFTGISQLGIGAAPNGNEKFTGYINDVRIFDHALSAAEIHELSKGLVLHYPLNRRGFRQDNIPNTTDALYSEMGLDNNIEYDVSGYQHNGTDSGIIYSSDTARYNTSVSFDGLDDGIIISDLDISNILNNQCTISFWIKPSGENSGRSVYFSAYTSTTWSIEKTAGNKLRSYWNGSPDTATTVSISDDVWQHIAITKNGTSDIKFYKDGQLIQSLTTSHPDRTFGTTWRLGRDTRSSDGTPYKGLMSDFRLYATALSADDISELYQHSNITS